MLSLLFAATLATVQPQMVVNTDWLAANIQHPDVRLLDVTTLEAYQKHHIPGAVFINSRALMVRRHDIPNELPSLAELQTLFREAGLNGSDRIILTSDDPLLATRAFFTLDYLGWGDRVAILDGGNAKWMAESRPTSKLPTTGPPSNFTPFVDRTAVISREELKALFATGQPVMVIDARDTRHFLGSKKGQEVEHAGHIPGATCFPASSHLQKHGRTLVLKNAQALEQMYASLDVTSPAQRIVVYCRTGVEATMNYFVLRYLGFHPTLYDGSFVEWSKTEPVISAAR